MNRHEHLLTIAAEECAEVAQRIAKAQRFGMNQVQQDADDKPEENPDRLSNLGRILAEFHDLVAVLNMAGILILDRSPGKVTVELQRERIDAKQARVEGYLERSMRCGTLERTP